MLPLCGPEAVCTVEGGHQRGKVASAQPSPRSPPGWGALVPLGPPVLDLGTFELKKMKLRGRVHGLARGGPRFR